MSASRLLLLVIPLALPCAVGAQAVAPYGLGCPRPAVGYELFAPGTIDLSGLTQRFQTTASGYVIQPGTGWATIGAVRLHLGDDEVSAPQQLLFNFNHPGGSTNTIQVSSNGLVYLVPGTIPSSLCCNGNVSTFLSQTPTIALLWQDLDPSAGGSIWFESNPFFASVTFDRVPEWGVPSSTNSAQVVLWPDGSIELTYQTVANVAHTCLVGYSEGNGAPDPGNLDLSSAYLTILTTGGVPLVLGSTAGSLPLLGTTYSMDITNIASGSVLGIFVFSFHPHFAGIDLGALGAPGCYQFFTIADSISSFPTGAATANKTLTLPNNPVFNGVNLHAQAGTVTPGANTAGIRTSNGLRLLLSTL